MTFLFFHYGKVPRYLIHAIEHVRIFNPDAQIRLITDSVGDTSMLDRFDVLPACMEDFPSEALVDFKQVYRHLSSCDERYESFCFERWFVTETIRRESPQKTLILLDSDVAVFGPAHEVLNSLKDVDISICGGSLHFTFIRESVAGFLGFILNSYSDSANLNRLEKIIKSAALGGKNININDQEFLLMYLNSSKEMSNYESSTCIGFADANIHRPEGFNCLQLRRRTRKKIFWQLEGGRAIPYLKRGDELVRSFILHFQGPGKRVFHRFNSIDGPTSPLQVWWWNQIFQKRWLANLM